MKHIGVTDILSLSAIGIQLLCKITITIWFLLRCCKDKTSHETEMKNVTTIRLALLVFLANIIYGTQTFIVAWEESGSGQPKFYAYS